MGDYVKKALSTIDEKVREIESFILRENPI